MALNAPVLEREQAETIAARDDFSAFEISLVEEFEPATNEVRRC